MGSINVRGNGTLFFDFRYAGVRCREYTALPDTPANRNKLQKVLVRIEGEIATQQFDYQRYFPGSRRFPKIAAVVAEPRPATVPFATPEFQAFAETWFHEKAVEWRTSHRNTVRILLDRHLLPHFGAQEVGSIQKADLLQFRASLAQLPGRHGHEGLSATRINHIMNPLRMILTEAAERWQFANPFHGIKSLKVPRTDVQPFTLDEVMRLLATVRGDFHAYYTVRFFTGLRTSEIDGLKWSCVDFARHQLLVRETLVAGRVEPTKTPESRREVMLVPIVEAALRAHQQQRAVASEYVFCNRAGQPLDAHNVTQRVWYPLLRHLGLARRRPYQTRHTAATLWLAAGENPEWIARQMGHTTTEMLFRIYSRYVPNLTRRDGSAMERLLVAHGLGAPVAAAAGESPC